MNSRPPCIAWAEKLALRYEDLSPDDRVALDEHAKTCLACRTAQAEYNFLDARLRALPPPTLKPIPRLSPLLPRNENEIGEEAKSGNRNSVKSAHLPPKTAQLTRRRRPFLNQLKRGLPVILVASLVAALFLLFGTRYINTTIGRPVGTTLFTYQGHTDFVDAVAWSPDGRYIASASWDHTVRVWDVKTRALLFSYAQADIVDALAWSPDGRFIASSSWDHTVQVWNVRTATLQLIYQGHADAVSSLAWSPDGRYIASGSWDHTVQVWNASTGKLRFSYDYNEFVNTVAWSPDGTRLAIGGANAAMGIQIVDAVTGKFILIFGLQTNDGDVVNALAWSPDSRYLVSADRDHVVEVWNANAGTLLLSYLGHKDEVRAVAWSPDGRYIASGGWDHTVQVWNAKTGSLLVTYRGHAANVETLAWSPDSRDIASGGWDDTVQVWQATSSG